MLHKKRTAGAKAVLRVLSVCLLFSGAISFGHAETKVSVRGDMDFAFSWIENGRLKGSKGPENDNFVARQRLRMGITVRTSESMKAFALIRLRPRHWGSADAGYALDTDGVNLRVRQMYMDWDDPSNPWHIRVGLVPVALPNAAFYNSVLYSTAGGVQVTYQATENIGLHLGLYRPYDEYLYDADGVTTNKRSANLSDEMDMAVFTVPMNFTDSGANITPWGVVARIGKDSRYWSQKTTVIKDKSPDRLYATTKDNGIGLWGGIAADLTLFDPLFIKFDAAYGQIKSGDKWPNFNASGWYTDLAVDYAMDWGTPGLFGWYASGSNYDDVQKNNKWGYIPTISCNDEGFNPTSFGFAGTDGIADGNVVSRQAAGHWGVGAQIKDISFVDNLSHLVRVAYYRGTNDKRMAHIESKGRAAVRDETFLTTQDYVWEANINHKWSIYENLTMFVDTGYLNMHRGDRWIDNGPRHAWQVVSNIKYTF